MKKFTFIILVFFFSCFLYAQDPNLKAYDLALPIEKAPIIPAKQKSLMDQWQKKPSKTYHVNGRDLTFINLGQVGGAGVFQNKPNTNLWADNYINSIVLTHSIFNPEFNFGYSVSWNGGTDGSWHESVPVYGDPANPGVYPQGGIINDYGNPFPDQAIYTYFSPTGDGSNGPYGGYAFGVNPLTQINPPTPTQNNLTSTGEYYRGIPEAFTLTPYHTYLTEACYPDAYPLTYNGNFIIEKGTYNESTGDIEYDEELMSILEEGNLINDTKIAFDPTGQIGYILVLSEAESDPTPYTIFHPILYETTDGGETWSEEPIHCQLGGPDGIEEIKQFVSDDMLISLFGADFERDSISYNLGYHADLVVDNEGNPHILGMIAPANDTAWFPVTDAMGTFHIWYDHVYGYDEWNAHLLYMNRTFAGYFGGMSVYNNPGISMDMMGSILFFSWNDTDQEGVDENVSPDIYTVAYDMWDWSGSQYSEVFNVTAFTQAMWTSYCLKQSYYIFEECNPAYHREFTVPFVYLEFDPNDPAADTYIWYIDGFTFEGGYCMGIDNNTPPVDFELKQNYPNPFNGKTTIDVNLKNKAKLSLEVYNLTGQKIFESNKKEVNAGSHQFTIDAKNLSKGVYLYTVKAGNFSETKKMIIE